MENSDEIEKIQKEVELLKLERERLKIENENKEKLLMLKKQKDDLINHNQSSGNKYYCGHCNKKIETTKGEEIDGNFKCPVCNKINTISSNSNKDEVYKDNSKFSNSNTIDEAELTTFHNKLSEFKLFTILSIFLDFFFIFTILGFVCRAYLESYKKLVNDDYKNSYSNWNVAFLVILFVKIILIGFRILSYL